MNLSRLMNELIAEGKIDKAKNIIELAMTKMPLDKFGYYSLVEPFAKGYYDVGEKAKAHDLLERLINKYKENLNYYAKLAPSEQSSVNIEIITDLERYRGLLIVMKESNDMDYYNSSKKTFNTYIQIFARFGRDKE
jgi:tetratricopeptide (TPR) repeat protein